MSIIIVNIINKNLARQINEFENGNPQTRNISHKELFIETYNLSFLSGEGKTTIGTTKVMKNCGMSWAYIAFLVEKNPTDINIFLAEEITSVYIPDLFKKAGKWLNEQRGRKVKDIPKFLEMSEEELNNHFIDEKKNLRKKGKID